MGGLRYSEAAVRERWTRWFRYFRDRLYNQQGKPDVLFARHVGVSRSFVSKVVRKKRQVGIDVALRTLRAFRRVYPDLTLDRMTFEDPPKHQYVSQPSTTKHPPTIHKPKQ